MISFRSVSYAYHGSTEKILDGVSFEISKGDFAVIKGKTGSGKSTIVHLLTAEAKPDAGEISVGPFELSELKKKSIPEYRRSIGCVFGDFALLEEKTISENISFALEIQRKYRSADIAKKTSDILERVALTEEAHRFPRELSAGSLQRAAIARALVSEPLVLIADEATGQLDREAAAGIHAILASENIRGMTILLTSRTDEFFPMLPKLAKIFELKNGKVLSS